MFQHILKLPSLMALAGPLQICQCHSHTGHQAGKGCQNFRHPLQWSVWGSDNAPSPGPSTAGLRLAPLSPRSGAAPLIGMAGSPSHSWPVDKDHMFPTDCPRRQLKGWEPPFLGDMARREQRVRRAGGLLQRCETLGSSGSLPWAGEGALAVLTAQLGWEKVWTSCRATTLHKSSLFLVGQSSGTVKHFPVPCKPTGLHQLAARQSQGPYILQFPQM